MAVPSIESVPFIVGTVDNVLVPEFATVRLLNVVVPETVCAAPFNITVLVAGVNVPLLVQFPLDTMA